MRFLVFWLLTIVCVVSFSHSSSINNTYVIYDNSSWWEEDYILKDLINIPNVVVIKLTENSLVSKSSYDAFTNSTTASNTTPTTKRSVS